MKKTKLTLGIILILLLALSTGLMAYDGGGGTSGNPFQIANTANLIELSTTSDDWDKYFIQTADIAFNADETQVDWDGSGSPDGPGTSGFSPIGNQWTHFTGSYDGDGYTIDNLYIDRSTYLGLFGYTNDGATISNLGMTNVDITGDYFYVGGLVGYINNSSTVSNSYSTGSVSSSSDYVGGLVGKNYNSSSVNNSYSTGSVSGIGHVGGLVGYNHSGGSTVSNSYSTGSVSGSGHVGGLVGANYYATVSNSYSTGSVSGSGGGLVGYNSSSTVSNSFWDTETSGQSSSNGGIGKTTAEMQRATTFLDAGWDFTLSGNVWAMNQDVNSSYPFLRMEGETPAHIWLGSTTVWGTSDNWSENSAPTSTKNVIVADVSNAPIISGINAECNSIIVEPNETVTLENNGNLTVSDSQ